MALVLSLAQTILPLPSPFPGARAQPVQNGGQSYIVYPSSDAVLVLDTTELQLVQTLPFKMGFASGSRGIGRADRTMGAFAVDEETGLIVASLSSQILILTPSSPSAALSSSSSSREPSKPTWKVHSTISNPEGDNVTSLAYHDGKLVVGSKSSLALWSCDMEDELRVWSRVWEERNVTTASSDSTAFSPEGEYISVATTGDRSLRLIRLKKTGEKARPKSKGQLIKLTRPLTKIWWRRSSKDSNPILYLLTNSSIFHVFSPILDDPTHFQLSSTISPPSSRPHSKCTNIFPLQASHLRSGVRHTLGSLSEEGGELDEGRKMMLKEIADEGANGMLGDLFVGLEEGGEVVVWAVVNIERKPPTLFKVWEMLRHDHALSQERSEGEVLFPTDPSTFFFLVATPSRHLASSSTSPSSSPLVLLAQTPSQPLQAFHLSPSSFFDPYPSTPSFSSLKGQKRSLLAMEKPARKMFRTPNGRSVLTFGEGGECVVWGLEREKDQGKGKGKERESRQKGEGVWRARAKWQEEDGVELVAVFARGRSVARYSPSTSTLSLRYLRPSIPLLGAAPHIHTISSPSCLPSLSPDHKLTTLIALSDIDDGVSTSTTLPTTSYVIASTADAFVYLWRLEAGDPTMRGKPEGEPKPTLVSAYALPFSVDRDPPAFVLAVDPMGWHQSVIDWKARTPLQDMLAVVGMNGELTYWTPRLDGGGGEGADKPWMRTGRVKTGRRDMLLAKCSSRKKTAMVSKKGAGVELSIWDSKSSEFYSGLEFSSEYGADETIIDLDWTTTSELQSVLAVGFAHHVLLLCQQRMSYVEGSGAYWAPILKLDISLLTPNPIVDSIWLSNGTLAVAAGNALFIHSRFLDEPEDHRVVVGSVYGKPTKQHKKPDRARDIFELVALANGPLVDYHPQLLLQCLLWSKVELVKSIVARLYLSIEKALNEGMDTLDWQRLEVEEFFGTSQAKSSAKPNGKKPSRYTSLFDDEPTVDEDELNGFSRSLVGRLVEHLEGSFYLPLTPHEREHLITLVQTVLEIEEQQRSLDLSGLRYLTSLRFFVLWNKRTPSGTAFPIDTTSSLSDRPPTPPPPPPLTSGHHHERLSFRNVVWAFHSESQEILLGAAVAASGGKMLWKDASAMGVFLWLRSTEALKANLEILARNTYMADDHRDPTTCSLYYFALGKAKLVQGLWKQAAWHPEQKIMLKFLGNDFTKERWQTAALKNAFALLSKQRYNYAAAFFLLGGSLKDAVNVCLRQLDDWQLAVALARIVEGDSGPVLKSILESKVIPLAFAGGHRWLGTWAFWMLKRRDLAVRILVTPLKDLNTQIGFAIPPTVGDVKDDDPSLALLFSQLKSMTLQTAKGTSEISERTEFSFVLHNARVFEGMGCHVLALDLVRSWSFERPFLSSLPPSKPKQSAPSIDPDLASSSIFDSFTSLLPSSSPKSTFRPSLSSAISSTSSHLDDDAPSPLPPRRNSHTRRRPSFFLNASARRHSLVIDVDLPETAPPTPRPSSPSIATPAVPAEPAAAAAAAAKGLDDGFGDDDFGASARKKGLGSLMKSAKDEQKQGAAEFSMDSFGF